MIDLSQHVLIGVDGGGTGCRAAVGTFGAGIVAQGQAGAANATTDRDLALDNIKAAVLDAAQQAGLSEDMLASATVHAGIAGVMTPQDGAHIAAALPYADIAVSDDRPTAVRGALGAAEGFVLSVGTGTIVASQTNNGIRCVGGWGFQLSDHGSGAWLGRAALEQVLLCHDGMGEHSAMTRAFLDRFGDDPNAIVAFGTTAQAGDYASFAPDIVAHAQADDPNARDLMQLGAGHLQRALQVLGYRTGQTLCLTGGVGPQYARYLPDGMNAGYADPLGTSLDGAFALAKDRYEATKGTT